ncbi:MAG: hypothetical protein ACOY40_10390 [Bacillota bacterium]
MFFIIEIKKKMMQAFKTLLAVAIMVILAMQLLGVIREATDYYRRWINRGNPHGNPMKVFREVDYPVTDGDDRILEKLKKYYKASNPEY